MEDRRDRQRTPSSLYWHRRSARNMAGRRRIPARRELHVLLVEEESWQAEDKRCGLCSKTSLLTLRMTARTGVVNFVCTYAPTLCSTTDEKDQFYDVLNSVVWSVPSREELFIMGDFNARVGAGCESWPLVIAHHGVGKMNENGQRILELCSFHKLAGDEHFPAQRQTWSVMVVPKIQTCALAPSRPDPGQEGRPEQRAEHQKYAQCRLWHGTHPSPLQYAPLQDQETFTH